MTTKLLSMTSNCICNAGLVRTSRNYRLVIYSFHSLCICDFARSYANIMYFVVARGIRLRDTLNHKRESRQVSHEGSRKKSFKLLIRFCR